MNIQKILKFIILGFSLLLAAFSLFAEYHNAFAQAYILAFMAWIFCLIPHLSHGKE